MFPSLTSSALVRFFDRAHMFCILVTIPRCAHGLLAVARFPIGFHGPFAAAVLCFRTRECAEPCLDAASSSLRDMKDELPSLSHVLTSLFRPMLFSEPSGSSVNLL